MGAIALSTFAIALTLVQMSCSKTDAQTPLSNPTQVGKILFGRNVSGGYEIWSVNYDGTNAAPISIDLPPNVFLVSNVDSKGIKVSPDGQKLFFIGGTIENNYQRASVYSCNLDGSNVQQIVQGNGGSTADILEVYQAF